MDYNESAQVAYTLLTDAGAPLPISRVIPGDYDPVEGTDTTATLLEGSVVGIVLPATFRSMVGLDNGRLEAGTLVLSKARKVLASAVGAPFEPDAGDTMTVDGREWEVLACVPLKPRETAIIYKIGLALK